MNDVQIKHMVERFLGWRLPDNFNPDGGISFKRTDPWPGAFGTNLLDAMQAEKMVRYMVDGMGAAAVPALGADELLKVLCEIMEVPSVRHTLGLNCRCESGCYCLKCAADRAIEHATAQAANEEPTTFCSENKKEKHNEKQ